MASRQYKMLLKLNRFFSMDFTPYEFVDLDGERCVKLGGYNYTVYLGEDYAYKNSDRALLAPLGTNWAYHSIKDFLNNGA